MKAGFRKLMTYAVLAIMISVFGYGTVRFWDAPISFRADGTYRGKQGQIHTKEDFDQFSLWEDTMVLWPGGMIVLFLLNKDYFSSKKRSPFSK
jgi:hypothetical protein